MVSLTALLRRTGLAGARDNDRPDPEKPLRGGLQRWQPDPPGWHKKWEPPTKGTTPADRKRRRNRKRRRLARTATVARS